MFGTTIINGALDTTSQTTRLSLTFLLLRCGYIVKLKGTNLNWFWHETDKIAQTSAGHIWCYPNVHVDNSIMVILGLPHETPRNLKGVCTDHAISWREFSS